MGPEFAREEFAEVEVEQMSALGTVDDIKKTHVESNFSPSPECSSQPGPLSYPQRIDASVESSLLRQGKR